MLRIGHRGFAVLRGFREGWRKTLSCELSLRHKGFLDCCEGFEGFARVCVCARGRGGSTSGTLRRQNKMALRVYTLHEVNPLYPRIFILTI